MECNMPIRFIVIFCSMIFLNGNGFLSWGVLAAEEESPVVIKEVTVKDSLDRMLKENERIKKEKEELRKELDEMTIRANIYVDRIRALNRKIDELTETISQTKSLVEEEKLTLLEKIEDIKKENTQYEQLVEYYKKQVFYDVHPDNIPKGFSKDSKIVDLDFMESVLGCLKKADAELKEVKTKVKEVLAEKEELKVENGKLHYNLGNMLFKNGEYERAVYEYELALKLLPDDPDIFYNLAVLYDYYVKNSQKASYYYTEYLQKIPPSEDELSIKERIADNDLKSKVVEERP